MPPRGAVKASAEAHTRYTARPVLRFPLGPFPVSVAPSFLLAAAILGFPFLEDLPVLALWILVTQYRCVNVHATNMTPSLMFSTLSTYVRHAEAHDTTDSCASR